MKLVKDATGEEVKVGEKLLSFRGYEATVVGWYEPEQNSCPFDIDGDSGYIIMNSGCEDDELYYPEVFNTHFEE